MKTLLTIGDSFTYGDELQDTNDAWPHLLGGKLNFNVINLGHKGSSNDRMTRILLEQDIDSYDAVVIGWSKYDRREFADEGGIYDSWPRGFRTIPRFEFPWRATLIDYNTIHHSVDWMYRKYLMNIIFVQSFLEVNNKHYLMADSFSNHKSPRRYLNDDLIKKINKDKFVGWPNESMMELSGDSPRGEIGHFLELGHQRVADKIYDIFLKTYGNNRLRT
jgi:hypothetical protein